jgi:hypothetical protein
MQSFFKLKQVFYVAPKHLYNGLIARAKLGEYLVLCSTWRIGTLWIIRRYIHVEENDYERGWTFVNGETDNW